MIDAFKSLLDNAENILITTHKSPDGDAIGSAAAFSRFVSAYGKNNYVLLPDPPAGNLMSFLDGVPYSFFDNFDLFGIARRFLSHQLARHNHWLFQYHYEIPRISRMFFYRQHIF